MAEGYSKFDLYSQVEEDPGFDAYELTENYKEFMEAWHTNPDELETPPYCSYEAA